jgi:phosphoribosylformimino-5-aminoimidazole carboxamide ribonucleotide (ProFAR) isomerase
MNNTSNRYHRREKCSFVQGDYNTKIIYNENHTALAKSFEAHGIQYLFGTWLI